jgi:hypothetical protein
MEGSHRGTETQRKTKGGGMGHAETRRRGGRPCGKGHTEAQRHRGTEAQRIAATREALRLFGCW